eukprot:6200636-Pleurochrysis_carterae.AAC.1
MRRPFAGRRRADLNCPSSVMTADSCDFWSARIFALWWSRIFACASFCAAITWEHVLAKFELAFRQVEAGSAKSTVADRPSKGAATYILSPQMGQHSATAERQEAAVTRWGGMRMRNE